MSRFRTPPASESDRFATHPEQDSSPNSLHPAFCFRYIQKRYGIPDDKAYKIKIINKLKTLGSMTWGSIKVDNREANGFENVLQLNKRIPSNFGARYPDTKVISFYLGNKGRMIGVRKRKVLYVFWFDWSPFKLYEH